MTITGQSHRKACKLNFYREIFSYFFLASSLQGQTILRVPFCISPPLQMFVNGPLDKQKYSRKPQLNET